MGTDDGGPAFPGLQGNDEYSNQYLPGMSLRDVFAGLAFAVGLANPLIRAEVIRAAEEERMDPNEYAARCAYRAADAMLEARK